MLAGADCYIESFADGSVNLCTVCLSPRRHQSSSSGGLAFEFPVKAYKKLLEKSPVDGNLTRLLM
jgi:hypothetical protein